MRPNFWGGGDTEPFAFVFGFWKKISVKEILETKRNKRVLLMSTSYINEHGLTLYTHEYHRTIRIHPTISTSRRCATTCSLHDSRPCGGHSAMALYTSSRRSGNSSNSSGGDGGRSTGDSHAKKTMKRTHAHKQKIGQKHKSGRRKNIEKEKMRVNS